MDGTDIKLALTVASLAPVPVLSNAASFTLGVIDVCTGSPVSGAISICTSVLPCGSIIGKAAGKVISVTAKGSTANKVVKVGAKALGNVDHIVHGAQALSQGPKYVNKAVAYFNAGTNCTKTAHNVTKAVVQAKDVASVSNSVRKMADYGWRVVQWGGKAYLKG